MRAKDKIGYNKIYQKSLLNTCAQYLLILIVAGKSGECPKAKLEREHHLFAIEYDLDAAVVDDGGGDVDDDGGDDEVAEVDGDRPGQPPRARPLAR